MVSQAAARVHAGVIYKDVELAEAPQGLPDKATAVAFLFSVADDEQRFVPGRLDFLRQFFTLRLMAYQAMHHHSSPCFGKPPRDSRPDSLSRAGDDGHLSR